ncbi:MAG: hypothetical protein LLF76_06060 [Planctomycetaceae bacterium]|nr:hypothetical protein [Planctomycetaceae bacterium]
MKRVVLGLAVLCGAAALAVAADTAGTVAKEPFATVDLSYTSKYIWRGFDKLDDVGAWQPSVDLDLGSGFSANLWMSYAGGSGDGIGIYPDGSRVNATEYNYTLAYSGTVNESCPWKTDYMVGWRYYDFIDMPSRDADLQEAFVTAEMPRLFDGGIVPHAAVFQMWPSQGDGLHRDFSGTIYLVGFNYSFALDQAPSLPLTFSWDIVYNDGVGGRGVDHDWSHMVWGLSTAMTCPFTGAKVVPAIYFQNSFEDTVNTEDELWGGISYSFAF